MDHTKYIPNFLQKLCTVKTENLSILQAVTAFVLNGSLIITWCVHRRVGNTVTRGQQCGGYRSEKRQASSSNWHGLVMETHGYRSGHKKLERKLGSYGNNYHQPVSITKKILSGVGIWGGSGLQGTSIFLKLFLQRWSLPNYGPILWWDILSFHLSNHPPLALSCHFLHTEGVTDTS